MDDDSILLQIQIELSGAVIGILTLLIPLIVLL